MDSANIDDITPDDDGNDFPYPPLVKPGYLDFGIVARGQSVTLRLAISNTGALPLLWIVDTGPAYWLTFDKDVGVLNIGETQSILVVADTVSLSLGMRYAVMLTVTALADEASASTQIPVTLTVGNS